MKIERSERLESIRKYHPSQIINDELVTRNMSRRDLARRIVVDLSQQDEIGVMELSLDMYLLIGWENPEMVMGETKKDFARVFDVPEEFFQNLENNWIEHYRSIS